MGKKQRTVHISEAISPTDYIISIITAFCDSFGRCPFVILCYPSYVAQIASGEPYTSDVTPRILRSIEVNYHADLSESGDVGDRVTYAYDDDEVDL